MDAKTTIKMRLPNRHVTEGPERAPHRSYLYEAGIQFDLFDVAEIFKKTPYIADLKPGGRYVAKDMFEAGDIPLLMKTLLDQGFLHGDCLTVTGRTIAENLKSVKCNPHQDVVRPADKPITVTGGVVGLSGNLAPEGAIVRTRSSVMRTFERIVLGWFLVVAPLSEPAMAFDGAPVNQDSAIPVVSGPAGAGAALRKSAPPSAPAAETSLTALQYAAEGGHPIAQWRLGRMYASGEGVARDDMRAFEYFSQVANAHAEDSPSAPQAAIVANAFVALGRYYLSGIPNSKVKADPDRAREMLSYAASYFGNADAQYDLARLYLKSPDASRDDFRYGARWLGLAAQKGQHQAQALLGQMLFNGDRLPRQAARGLMWLTLARDGAAADEAWIKESYNRAFAKASDDDRASALQMLEHWVQGKRD